MKLTWSAVDEALLSAGSRSSAISTMWCMVPEDQRTPARRKLTIAMVDFLREHVAQHGIQRPTLDDIAAIAAGDAGSEP